MDKIQVLLALSVALFAVGLLGVVIRRNMLVMLMCMELMLNGVNLNLVAPSHFLESLRGQAFTFFIITVAAAEAAIGLGIAIALYRSRRSVHVDTVNQLKG